MLPPRATLPVVPSSSPHGRFNSAKRGGIIGQIDATLQISEALSHRLERLAEEEGTSVDVLLRRLAAEHSERRGAISRHRPKPRKDVPFSLLSKELLSKEETGVILPVAGGDIDEMCALYNIAS